MARNSEARKKFEGGSAPVKWRWCSVHDWMVVGDDPCIWGRSMPSTPCLLHSVDESLDEFMSEPFCAGLQDAVDIWGIVEFK